MNAVKWRKPLTLLLTVAITAYLIHKVYSEASGINVGLDTILSPPFLLAIATSVVGYFLYTTLWYVYVRRGSRVGFRRVFFAMLVGTYLGFSLNAAVGTLVKVRLLGTEYWFTFGVGLLAITTEFLSGLLLLALLAGSLKALFLALLLATLIAFDRLAYWFLYPFFYLIRALGTLEDMYRGWHEARANLCSVLVGIATGLALVLMNALTLKLVGTSLGVSISVTSALEAVLYSGFLGGLLGTPGGIGANELGITLAIGDAPTAVVAAFLYKFINQYAYAIIGAFAFYRYFSRDSGINDGDEIGTVGEDGGRSQGD